jgi:biopolymer transport protein ExbD
MAMATGGAGSQITDPNVTPMIDVLLVLLVIFMVMIPLLQRSIDVQVPLEEQEEATSQAAAIVLEMLDNGRLLLNTQVVPPGREGLEAKLHEVYDIRPDKVLFFKVEPNVKYGDVVTALDIARGAGVVVLGAVLP